MRLSNQLFTFITVFQMISLAQAQAETNREPASVPTSEKIHPIEAAQEKTLEIQGSALLSPDLKVKVGGFAWVEFENTNNFGYNGNSTVPDFQSSAPNSHQNFSTLFSNLQIDLSKGSTALTSVFEIGEVVDGDQTTGGSQGAGQRILEVRNLYLTHQLNSSFTLKAGLLPFAADPNGYVLSNHMTAAILNYHQEGLSVNAWASKGRDNKPGTSSTSSSYVRPDSYWGLQIQTDLNENTKNTLYGISRRTSEKFYDADTATAVTGGSSYQWLGTTLDHTFNDLFSVQGTYIANQGQFKADSNGPSDSMRSNLADIKFKTVLKESKTEILIEALATSGSNDQFATGNSDATLGKRGGFVAPDPGAAYLLTIATSDGADDAPGATKESIVGNLNQSQGVQAAVVKISKSFSDNFAGFIRYGFLQSSVENTATKSRAMGQEWDIEGNYELSPGTTLQVDAAVFTPGAFFAGSDAANLLTTRLKFDF